MELQGCKLYQVFHAVSEIQVKVDLPGHSAKDILVKLEGDTLNIHSE
jgi:HSP20 family molecular chaperone IbpA